MFDVTYTLLVKNDGGRYQAVVSGYPFDDAKRMYDTLKKNAMSVKVIGNQTGFVYMSFELIQHVPVVDAEDMGKGFVSAVRRATAR